MWFNYHIYVTTNIILALKIAQEFGLEIIIEQLGMRIRYG